MGGLLISLLIAQLAKIDWTGIARDKIPGFVRSELRSKLNGHVKHVAESATAQGWSYTSVTDSRPHAPDALIADYIYRFEKGIIPGGVLRDAERDLIAASVGDLVKPQINPTTPPLDIAQYTADAIISVIF